MATTNPDISVVVPLYNEQESLPELLAWIRRVMEANSYSFEVIFIDDGSSDNSWNIVRSLRRNDPNVRGIRFRRNYGKSAALLLRIRRRTKATWSSRWTPTCRTRPTKFPSMRRMILARGLRHGVRDGNSDVTTRSAKRWPSKFFNWTVRAPLSGIKLHDFNCGLKAYRRKVVKVDRSLRRDAPLHPDPGQGGRIPPHRREGSLPQGAQVRAPRSSAWERMIKGLPGSGNGHRSCRNSADRRCTFSEGWVP